MLGSETTTEILLERTLKEEISQSDAPLIDEVQANTSKEDLAISSRLIQNESSIFDDIRPSQEILVSSIPEPAMPIQESESLTTESTSVFDSSQVDSNETTQQQKRGRGRPANPKPQTPRRSCICLNATDRQRVKDEVRAEKKSARDVAKRYSISAQTVYKILKETKPLKPRNHVRKRKLQAEHSQMLASALLEDPSIKAKEMQLLLKNVGVNVSVSTINKHVRSARMSEDECERFLMKKLDVPEEKQNNDVIKDKRVIYLENYMLLEREPQYTFVFIDETPFTHTSFEYAEDDPPSQPAILRREMARIHNFTAITAISTFGVLHSEFVEGNVNDSVFIQFLTKLFEVLLQYLPCVLIMDNASFYKTDSVREFIQNCGHIVLFAPSWSCELKPIEYVFEIWKRSIMIPNNLTDAQQIIPILDESLKKFTCVTVHRSIAFVRQKLFPLALLRRDLFLDNEITEFEKISVPPNPFSFTYSPTLSSTDSSTSQSAFSQTDSIMSQPEGTQ